MSPSSVIPGFYENSGEKIKAALSQSNSMLSESEYFLNYFNNLHRIEKHYDIRFADFNINSINKIMQNTVLDIIVAINGKPVEYKWHEELTMELIEDYPDETIEQLKAINKTKTPIAAFEPIEEMAELHGHEINLGYKKTDFPEAIVINLQKIYIQKIKHCQN